MSRTRSHVFVAHGDLHQLACDAWLLPTDVHGTVTPAWRAAADDGQRAWIDSLGGGLRETCVVMPRTAAGEGSEGARASGPAVVATALGLAPGAAPAEFLPPLTAFVARGAAEARARTTLRRRERPLLAIPAVGTGEGGGADAAGALLRALFPHLQQLADAHGVDVAFVARGPAMHAAAQRARLATPAAFDALGPGLLAEARRLAAEARAGRLVLFLGAGVSAGAGLPGWSELLKALADRAGVPWEGGLADFGALEQGEILARRLEQASVTGDGQASTGDGQAPASIGDEVARLLRPHGRHALGHALLAALPVREAITQNYDELFERASAAAHGPEALSVLPFAPRAGASRWLLKMHGTVALPSTIVLSRTDYLRYAEERGALMGIVQAMLLTRHMLFVGFSLNDPNFHRIADSVRRAAEPARSGGGGEHVRGTVLTFRRHALASSVWPEVQWVEALADRAPGVSDEDDRAAAARQVDVFLDALGAHAVGPAPLLEDRFAALQSTEEAAAVGPLRELAALHARRTHDSPVWDAVGRLLRELGGDPS